VYIIFLPAQGFMSTLIGTFTGRSPFGYLALVLSLVATAFIGFGVWVHHMFATGLPQLGTSFFTAASIMITVPSGVQIFCWIATFWSGRVRYATPMLYALAFFAVFLIGGLSGVMVASVPLDQQVHDSFFVVAHLHYVLIGGAVFPLLGAMHYWFPKITGRQLDERLGRISFAVLFVGFNLTFFPMHTLGLHGMPRRVYTYAAATGWQPLNVVATVGAGLMFLALTTYCVNVLIALRAPATAEANPWRASTLEWLTTSPPPVHNFDAAPVVTSREPLWRPADDRAEVTGLSSETREVLVTYVTDASPDHIRTMPQSSFWPFLTAVATSLMFIWSIFSPWGIVGGSVPVTGCLIGWFWPANAASRPTKAPLRPEPAA
jgi:cytochrome c oxidase subunit 1